MQYRADIDGLRALAVLGVVLFHGGVSALSGGFIGVDIFFVISGFLITTIIDKDIGLNRFSYKNFWIKRIRRIFPASLFCFVLAFIYFSFVLTPHDYALFGKSLVSLGLFSSNIFFWRQSGYFSDNSELLPLLHTWSLSIEEQFYLFLPITIILLSYFFKKHRDIIFGLLTLSSFVACIILTDIRPSGSFYLLPTRAWELGIGSLVAFYLRERKVSSNGPTSLALTFLSIGLMVIPMFTFDKTTVFPGSMAMLPVSGAALFILLPYNSVKRVFTLRPVLFIGKVSYSFYLWHWVALVGLRFSVLHHPSWSQNLFVILLSFVFSVISYYLIEEPVRRNLAFWTNKKIFLIFVVSSLFYLGAGLYLIKNNGIKERFSEDFRDFKETTTLYNPQSVCKNWQDNICTISNNIDDPSINFFVWGDSHAQANLLGFIESAKELGLNFGFSIKEGCPPLPKVILIGQTDLFNDKCLKHNDEVLSFITKNKIQTFLVFRYDIYFNERLDYERTFMPERFLGRNAPFVENKDSSFKVLTDSLRNLVFKANPKQFIFLKQVPAFKVHPLIFANKAQVLGHKIHWEEDVEEKLARTKRFDVFVEKEGGSFLDPMDIFCNKKTCSPYSLESESLYYDDDHLGTKGSVLLKDLISKRLLDLNLQK